MSAIVESLSAIQQGHPQASEQLLPLVYDEFGRLAAQKMSQELPGQTLEATAHGGAEKFIGQKYGSRFRLWSVTLGGTGQVRFVNSDTIGADVVQPVSGTLTSMHYLAAISALQDFAIQSISGRGRALLGWPAPRLGGTLTRYRIRVATADNDFSAICRGSGNKSS